MTVKYKFLFNFSVTTTGGGLKRLNEYSKWFNENGGAWFIIHPNCEFFKKEFPNNKYFVVFQNRLVRLFRDCNYLSKLKKEVNVPDLYYSYGIPIYYKFGKINWFHVTNVLPFCSKNTRLSFFDKYVKFKILRWKIINNYQNTDIVSAESHNSLNMIKDENIKEKLLSLNGSNDEIGHLKSIEKIIKKDIAVIVGTQSYKNIDDSYKIFKILKKKNNLLKLIIVGNQNFIPKYLIDNNDVIINGVIKQSEVIELLKKAKYFISTTEVENSFNAASEGIVFSKEAYISDIEPHRELLKNELHDFVSIPTLSNKIIKTNGKNIIGKNLKLWNDVILEKIKKVESLINMNHIMIKNDKNHNKEKLTELICNRLESELDSLKKKFLLSKNNFHTRFVVVEDLLPKDFAKEIYNNFPKKEKMRLISNFREKKYTFKQLDHFSNFDITFAFQSKKVISLIEQITGIFGQHADPKLYAGGLSLMKKNDFLNPHIDNSHNINRECYRRLNLLYYVTPDWKLEYGGNLELWDVKVKKFITIPSLFNSFTIMETNKNSWHSVSPVKYNGYRCCVSNYYFSKQSPSNKDYFHITTFNGRPHQRIRRFLSKVDNISRNAIRLVFKKGISKIDLYNSK